MDNKITNFIIGLMVLVLTAGGFAWVWSKTKVETEPVVSESLKPIEIESIKKEAAKILVNRENFGNIPIPVPIEKMGRDNPFLGF